MLKLKYENKTDIPEGLDQYYTENDGLFVLQAEGVKSEDDIKALKNALDSERKLKRDAESKVKEMNSKFGLLPDDFNIDAYNQLADGNGGNVETKLKEQADRMNAQFKKLMEAKDGELNGANDLVHKHVKVASLQRAMAENNIARAYMPAVEAMMKDKIKVVGEDVLLDDLPIDDALKAWTLSKDGKHYVSASQNTGGGADGKSSKNTGAKEITRTDFDGMSQGDRQSFFSDGGKVIAD